MSKIWELKKVLMLYFNLMQRVRFIGGETGAP
jgi:hypothetical protein